MMQAAIISECKQYRYRLERIWDTSKPMMAFIMLNPSTADAFVDDPTIRRCINFAKEWGYGGLIVGNLFALRSTQPKKLFSHSDPVGPDNDAHLYTIAREAELVVAAWGNHGSFKDRDKAVVAMAWKQLCALGVTKSGQPGHPLYLKSSTRAVPYPPSAS